MSNPFGESWALLSKEEKKIPKAGDTLFPKRPILGNRILTPVEDKQEEKRKRYEEAKRFDLRPPYLSSLIHALPRVDGEPNPPNPIDLAMEEIRAAQAEREAHRQMLEQQQRELLEQQQRQFEEMMSGSFASAFPPNMSEEMSDLVAAYMLQGYSKPQAEELARQYLGE